MCRKICPSLFAQWKLFGKVCCGVAGFLVLFLVIGRPVEAQQAAAGQPGAGSLTSPQIEERVNALLRQMTLEEKIGQLAQLAGQAWFPGAGKPEDHLRKGEGGSVLWLSQPRLTAFSTWRWRKAACTSRCSLAWT